MRNSAYPFDHFATSEVDPRLCFVASPFRQEFDASYAVVKETAEAQGYVVRRVDGLTMSGIIHADIWDGIAHAGVIVADISGFNPNVMLEVGVAVATKPIQQVILIMRETKGDSDQLFDLQPFRHFTYTNTIEGAANLRKSIRDALAAANTASLVLRAVSEQHSKWFGSNKEPNASVHDPRFLLTLEMLSEIKLRPDQYNLTDELKAFVVASAIQHGEDLVWWWETFGSSRATVEIAAETVLFGPHIRPRFRAAFILSRLESLERLRLSELLRLEAENEVALELIDAIEHGTLEDLLRNDENKLLTQSQRVQLLQNFSSGNRRKFSFLILQRICASLRVSLICVMLSPWHSGNAAVSGPLKVGVGRPIGDSDLLDLNTA